MIEGTFESRGGTPASLSSLAKGPKLCAWAWRALFSAGSGSWVSCRHLLEHHRAKPKRDIHKYMDAYVYIHSVHIFTCGYR